MEPIEAFFYALAMRPPYQIRRGILLKWPDESWTEAAPLPGWSRETIDDVAKAIRQKEWQAPLPSLQFALQKFYRPAKEFCDNDLRNARARFPYCGLLTGTPKEILRRAHQHSHAKIKLSHMPLEEAIALVQRLPPQLKLRIDFNRTLTLKEAWAFATACEREAIEFYEEPLRNPKELCDFPFPLALDESLREPEYAQYVQLPQVKALVVKPTLTGNLAACQAYAQFDKPIILSSSFESGVGIRQILEFASCFTSILPLGIDTGRYFTHDILLKPLRIEQECVYLDPQPSEIDLSLLTKFSGE
jgi:O-succinylbenzoate synthase